MNSIQNIALSKMADILSSSNLIIPQVDIWKKIFNNAGLSDLYENRASQLTTKIEAYGYNPSDKNYYHNELCYNGLYKTFNDLTYDKDRFLKLLNSIVDKMSIYSIFTDDVEHDIKRDFPKIKKTYIDEIIEELNISEKNLVLAKYANRIFKSFKNNCNLLELDICFGENELEVFPFTGGIRESRFENSVLLQQLSSKYPNIADSYMDAIKAYSNQDEVACITHCRNIITGIFSYKKDEQRKWIDGLQKACCNDKNITNVTANKIRTYNYNANSPKPEERYQYPRFNLFYNLYSYTCALGAHINEGNVNGTDIDFENASLEDAFLALRMTEDALIWLYQTGTI
jgi:hypothetical protein